MKNSILFALLVVFGSINIISCGEPSTTPTTPIKTERSFEVICDTTETDSLVGYHEDPETGERIGVYEIIKVVNHPCDTIYID